MYKKARNPVKEKGFDSKAQMRYLLMLMRKYPDKYSWVKDALKTHGAPATEGPLRTYWEPPYNVSPDTPSYIYTGRRSQINTMIVKFADKLVESGKTHLAIHIVNPWHAANAFWAMFKVEMKADKANQEALVTWFEKFDAFLDKNYPSLTKLERVEAHRSLGDKILDREVK